MTGTRKELMDAADELMDNSIHPAYNADIKHEPALPNAQFVVRARNHMRRVHINRAYGGLMLTAANLV